MCLLIELSQTFQFINIRRFINMDIIKHQHVTGVIFEMIPQFDLTGV